MTFTLFSQTSPECVQVQVKVYQVRLILEVGHPGIFDHMT